MIRVIALVVNLLAPIVNMVGLFGLLGCVVYDDLSILGIAATLFILGLIFGIAAYRLDIPPRWFWSKSKNELFEFAITATLGYAWNFAMWPCAIYIIKVIIDKM